MIQKLVFVINHGGEEYALKHAPEEWDETSIRWKRSLKYFGISRSFSLPLKFVKDGAKLLRHIFYDSNIEAEAQLKIYNHINLSVGYRLIYQGDFDFSTFVDQDDFVEINIADNNIEARINSNENTEYEFDIKYAKHQVSMPEIPKVDKAEGNVSSANWIAKYLSPSYIFANTDQIDENIFHLNSPDEGSTNNWSNIISAGNNLHVIEAYENKTITVSLDISIAGINEYSNQSNIYFAVYDNDSGPEDAGIVHKEIFRNGRFKFEFDLDIEAGKRYFFIFRTTPFSFTEYDNLPVIFVETSTIIISYSNPTEQLTFKAFRADELFNLLIEKMTGVNPEFENEALGQIKISSGDGVRNIEDAKIKTSFNSFFKSIYSVTGYCFGLELGNPILAPYEYFFNVNLPILDVGNVKEIEVKPASDFLYGNIKIGYKNQTYEEELGKDEYNTEQQYSTGLNRIKTTLDLVSDYRADHLGIRKIRIDLANANLSDEDREGDNDIFMVFTETQPFEDNKYRAITADDFVEVNGIDGRTDAINLNITPKRNLLNHSDFLAGALYRTNAILFETAKKDVNLRTVNEFGEVLERSNVYISELSTPLFLPILIKFVVPIGVESINEIDNKTTGYISFRYKKKIFRGFIIETSANISQSDSVEITVLMAPNTNLNNLIR